MAYTLSFGPKQYQDIIRRLNTDTPYVEERDRRKLLASMTYDHDKGTVSVWVPPTKHILHCVISDLQWIRGDLSDRMIPVADVPYTIPATEFLLSQTCLPACLDLWPALKGLIPTYVIDLLTDDRVTHEPYEVQPYDMTKLDAVTTMIVTHKLLFKDAL